MAHFTIGYCKIELTERDRRKKGDHERKRERERFWASTPSRSQTSSPSQQSFPLLLTPPSHFVL